MGRDNPEIEAALHFDVQRFRTPTATDWRNDSAGASDPRPAFIVEREVESRGNPRRTRFPRSRNAKQHVLEPFEGGDIDFAAPRTIISSKLDDVQLRHQHHIPGQPTAARMIWSLPLAVKKRSRAVADVRRADPAVAQSAATPLVLASSSRYRKELLDRLGIPFSVDSPNIDESPAPGETPRELVVRLSIAKARAVASRWPNAVVIGSDQAATFDGHILGKPGTVDAAVRQLRTFSGRNVEFLTGIAILNAGLGRVRTAVDTTTARFRQAGDAEIRRYVEHDMPLDCAGGIRFEGLGPMLLDGVDTMDPSAALGLPLIALGELLRAEGVNPLAHPGD